MMPWTLHGAVGAVYTDLVKAGAGSILSYVDPKTERIDLIVQRPVRAVEARDEPQAWAMLIDAGADPQDIGVDRDEDEVKAPVYVRDDVRSWTVRVTVQCGSQAEYLAALGALAEPDQHPACDPVTALIPGQRQPEADIPRPGVVQEVAL